MRYRVTSHQEPQITSNRRLRTRASCSAAFGPWGAPTPSSWIPSETTKEIWDVEVLNFRSLLESCGKSMLPINPVTIRTTSTERVQGTTAQHLIGNASCWLQEQLSDVPVWFSTGWLVEPPEFDNALLDVAKTAAIAELRAASYDALTDIIEIRKSVALFHELAGKMDSFIKTVIRKVKEKVKTKNFIPLDTLLAMYAQEAANYWLKYRYGVMPIVYSLEDILRAQRGLRGGLIRDKSSVSETLNDTQSLTWEEGPSATLTTTQTLSGSRIYRATAFGNVDIGGLGSFDPLVSLYETAKWTWILDWMMDVGSFLQAVSPFAQVTTKAVCLSVKTTYERRQSVKRTWHNVSSTDRHSGDTGSCMTIETVSDYQRWASDTDVPWPRWNPQLNWKRLTDLVALVVALKALPLNLLRV
jgi:hypothetical protein